MLKSEKIINASQRLKKYTFANPPPCRSYLNSLESIIFNCYGKLVGLGLSTVGGFRASVQHIRQPLCANLKLT